jgi:hypothetical protein
MTGAEKTIINTKEQATDIIDKMQKKGYNKIELCFIGNPRHKNAGLSPEQILVIAYRYHPRPDKRRKVSVVAQPIQLQTIEKPYTCEACGIGFDTWIDCEKHKISAHP